MQRCLGTNTGGTEMNSIKVLQYESAQIRTLRISEGASSRNIKEVEA